MNSKIEMILTWVVSSKDTITTLRERVATLEEESKALDKEIDDLSTSIGFLIDENLKLKSSLKKMSLWNFIKIRYGK